jgi:hypothetical protein
VQLSQVFCDIIQVYNLDNSDFRTVHRHMQLRCLEHNFMNMQMDEYVYRTTTRLLFTNRFDALIALPAPDRIYRTLTAQICPPFLNDVTSEDICILYEYMCTAFKSPPLASHVDLRARPIIAHRRDRANREPR